MCKSVVNDLRHGNYRSKSEGIYLDSQKQEPDRAKNNFRKLGAVHAVKYDLNDKRDLHTKKCKNTYKILKNND